MLKNETKISFYHKEHSFFPFLISLKVFYLSLQYCFKVCAQFTMNGMVDADIL